MQTNLVKSDFMRFFIAVTIAVVVSVPFTSFARAQKHVAEERTGRFFVGAALGLQDDTPDGTAFSLGLYGDHYLTPEFSIGPLLQTGFTNDLSQLGLSAQAKYTFALAETPALNPHVQSGIGIIHADLERRGWRDGKDTDTSFLIPLGVGAEYKLTPSVSLDNTFLFNFTNLDVRDERFFFGWLIGLKFPF